MMGMTMRRLFSTGAFALSAAMATVAFATDLEDFYLRHDFSGGTRETSFGASSPLTADPVNAASPVSVAGLDGADTAVHPANAWGETFGANGDASLLNSDWSVAASVKAAAVDGGVIFSLGRLNANNLKEVALCSSATDGKLVLKVMARDASKNKKVECQAEATVVGTTVGFHALVLVYQSAGTAGQGTFTLYWDGAKACELETSTSVPFGNGFQYATLLSISTAADFAALGCANVSGDTALAFQDMRIFTSALTAEDAAAYAALYPAVLPGFSNLDSYAYVQSYGVNAVDSGYKAKSDTAFSVDFEFTDASEKQARIFGCYSSYDSSNISQDGLTSGLYINGSLQFAFAKFSTYKSGATWMTFGNKPAGDTNRRIFTTKDVSANETKGTLSLYDRTDSQSSSTTTNHGTDSTRPVFLFANNNNGSGNYCSKTKIYSFGASEGTANPAIFLAPDQEGGAAGFRNILTGEFHGETMSSPSTALSYQPGIGQAADYRYRSGKFYARIYASSADSAAGLVKFEGGEAAGTIAQFTARGKTAKISAVSVSGDTFKTTWSGDTWAITGSEDDGNTIEVQSDTAIHLVATIAAMPKWTNSDGTGSLDSTANWTQTPESGEDVILELAGDTVITASEAKTFGSMTIKGAYSVDFSGAETVTLSGVELSGVTNLVTGGKMRFTAIAVPAACTVTITGAEGLAAGGVTGSGTLVIDPGAGNTYTMSKSNTGFTGEAVIKSGIVKFGDYQSFGLIGRNAFIRVKGGAVLDENAKLYYSESGESLNKAILEDGATLRANPGYSQLQYSVLTTINLKGNATIDTSYGNVSLSERWNEHAVALNLGTNVLVVSGTKNKFGISHCTISGTGMIDIQSGATVESTHCYYDNNSSTVCANGTIRIREGGKWNLADYYNNTTKLSVKNLILDGSVTRAKNTYTLTVTGSITGNGTTPMLTMAYGAKLRPDGSKCVKIAEALEILGSDGKDGGNLSIELPEKLSNTRVPLFRVGSETILPSVERLDLTVPTGWELEKVEDGDEFGYDLVKKPAFTIRIL